MARGHVPAIRSRNCLRGTCSDRSRGSPICQGCNVTVETFCTSGQAERFKGSVHAAAGTIVGAMAVYNAVAWCYRRERHLGWNAIIYGLGFAWEAYQTSRHFTKPTHPI